MREQPALRPLHEERTLSQAKLLFFERWDSNTLRMSLAPGQEHCLKCRADGTMLDGHHRVYVLRHRGENVDSLPREVLPADA